MKYAIIQNGEFVGATECVVTAEGVELLPISDEVYNDIDNGVEYVYADGELTAKNSKI